MTASEAWERWCRERQEWPEFRAWCTSRTGPEIDAERERGEHVAQAEALPEGC